MTATVITITLLLMIFVGCIDTNASHINDDTILKGSIMKTAFDLAPKSPTKSFKKSPAKSAKNLRQQATLLWNKGTKVSKKAAIAVLDEAIARFPDDSINYRSRGDLLGYLQRYDAAIADLRKAVELQPNCQYSWGLLGWFLILQGDFSAGQTASAKALELAPDVFTWNLNLGHAYLLQGNILPAYKYYATTIELMPNCDAFIDGPMADFKLFIKNSWKVEASKQAMLWMKERYNKRLHTLAELAAIKKQMGVDDLQGPALAWWQKFEKLNAKELDTVLLLLKAIQHRQRSINDFFQALTNSKEKNVTSALVYMVQHTSPKTSVPYVIQTTHCDK